MGLSPLRIVINGIDNFSQQFQQVNASLRQTSQQFAAVGSAMTNYVTLPLAGAAVAGGKFAMDLNKAMANVQTLMPESLGRVKELKKGVQDLAITTGKSTIEIANGLYQTVSAFGDNEETMDRLSIASKAAVAGLSTTTDALKLLSGVTKGYNNTTKEAVQLTSDYAFKTVELGETSFPELASNMARVVPIAKALGVEQKELFAIYAATTGAAGNTAEITTRLGAVMNSFMKPTEAMKKTVAHLTGGTKTAAEMLGGEGGLYGALRKIVDITEGDTQALGMLLGSTEAISLSLALTGAQSKAFEKKLIQMGGALGTTKKAFTAQAEGINEVGFNLEQTKQRITVAMQGIGDKLLPIFDKLLQGVSKVVDAFSSLSPEMQSTILIAAGLFAAMGPLLLIISKLIIAVPILTGAITGAGGIIALLTSPISLTIMAIVGLIAIVALLWDEIKPLREAIMDVALSLWEMLKPAVTVIIDIFKILWSIFKKVVVILSPLIALYIKLWGYLGSNVVWVLVKAFQALGYVLGGVLKILDYLLGKVASFINLVGEFFGIVKSETKETAAIIDNVQPPELLEVNKEGPGGLNMGMFGGLTGGGPGGIPALTASPQESKVTLDFINVMPGLRVTKVEGNVDINTNNGVMLAGGA